LHLILALEKVENGRLAKIMESGNKITDGDIKDIQNLIRDCGALEEAKSISRNHAMEAVRLIPETDMNEEAKDFFVSFINYVAESLEWYK
jgi:geranylgeranyl pyrophosphate synthase